MPVLSTEASPLPRLRGFLARVDRPGVLPYWWVPAGCAAGAILIAVLGWLGHVAVGDAAIDYVYPALESGARVKAAKLAAWHDENGEDLERVLERQPWDELLRLRADRSPAGGRALLDALNDLCATPRFAECQLRSADDGRLWLTTGAGEDSTAIRQWARQTAQGREPLTDGLTVAGDGEYIHPSAGYYVTLRGARVDARPLAVVRVRRDATEALVALMRDGPEIGGSLRTRLLHADDGGIVLIDRLDALDDKPRALRRAPPRPDSVEAQALRGEPDLLEGTDARGVEVLAYALPLGGTPWRIVAEVDRSDVYAPADRIGSLAAFAATFLLLTAGLTWTLRQRYAFAHRRDTLERDVLTRRIDYLARYANDCILQCEPDGRIVEANDRCLAVYGRTARALQGMHFADLCSTAAERERTLASLGVLQERGSLIFESEHRGGDGLALPVEVSASSIEIEGYRGLQVVVRDIGERKRMERDRNENLLRLAELSHRLVSVQELERRRLSAELHDRTGPNLATVKLNLRAIENRLASADPALLDLLQETRDLLLETISDIRDLCTDLRPAILDHGGLVPALEGRARQLERSTGLAVRLDADPGLPRLAPETETMLYRVAQEAMNNCAKHAMARNLGLRLARNAMGTVLTVTDDGVGFDPQRLDQECAAGHGLLTMRERAEFAGARFLLDSVPGRTTIQVIVPERAPPVPSPPADGERA